MTESEVFRKCCVLYIMRQQQFLFHTFFCSSNITLEHIDGQVDVIRKRREFRGSINVYPFVQIAVCDPVE